MALREDFESTGNWLFRWRSYLPIAVIGMFLLAMLDYQYPWQQHGLTYVWEGLCLLVSFLGFAIRIVTIGHTPKNTSGRNTKEQIADSLNTSGIYATVRNPLYLGNFFMALGMAMFPQLWWLVLLYCLIFWLYYERIIFAEEAFLRHKFGDAYLQWANTTPVFIPRLRQYSKAQLPFSLRNVLKREYNGFFAIVAMFVLLKTFGIWIVEGQLRLDPYYAILLGVGFALWLVLRTIKKTTTWLHVDGR